MRDSVVEAGYVGNRGALVDDGQLEQPQLCWIPRF